MMVVLLLRMYDKCSELTLRLCSEAGDAKVRLSQIVSVIAHLPTTSETLDIDLF